MDATDAPPAALFPIVSTIGFEGEGALRRFRRWSVADVSARYLSQALGETVSLWDAPIPHSVDGAARAQLVPAAIAAIDRLPATRLDIAPDRLTLTGDDLLEDVLRASDSLHWPERILAAQRAAIGGSRGALVRFARTDGGGDITVFTTRPDTLFGATFVAVSPTHPVARQAGAARLDAFQAESGQGGAAAEAKVGIPLGVSVEHPFIPGQTLPVWLANFVVEGYGTGATGGCPACDQRDLDFARRYQLPVFPIICPPGQDPATYQVGASAHPGDGTMINSGFLNGLPVTQAMDAAIARLAETGRGQAAVQYRRTPLAVATAAPEDGSEVRRHGRCWRFTDSFLTAGWFAAPSARGRRVPHLLHVTTPETATRHLLDARILWRALDGTLPSAHPEPWEDVVLIGDILHSPAQHVPRDPLWASGDALRIAVLADTPPERDFDWSDDRHSAAAKLAERARAPFGSPTADADIDVASLASRVASAAARLEKALRLRKMNTAIAAAHEIIAETAGVPGRGLNTAAQAFLGAMLYALLPEAATPALTAGWRAPPRWPQIEQQRPECRVVEIMVQIGGKKRGIVRVTRDADEEAVLAAIRADASLNARLGETPIRKTILVPNRLVNLVL